ncbi:MAG: helix-turn-helix transcriptional regulator [Bifidobacterium scardovii]|uniref:helix-turn-helix transcriptional regulator n=1 Tax=Bifidobacterium scardovii TaxID=158787 RepID=UPI000667E2DB|nr:helix-turn-helix transcriptional regulator [Bifidobacterium scardovii]MBS6948346.1 helix-turn-helix transcriptional regulator [Bifidobacterium scardovii]MDU2421259.1 helix-turn-helix transcriptional regulator [Bifidobacterium scardovii]MDU3737603.1 helix-turn-helix transcriptional regulator [Bifidobacterium scardovii]MDU5298324.1 helix-turn-helix transcriptional regulator [Bifidobacterium scardovii]MDU5610430.1 helix-turn-helix transcriptional regulator [Bifidobacterium scardovii]
MLHTSLADYRREKNMTQRELAELVDVRRETIMRLEKGRYNPSLRLAMDLAEVFGVTVEDLFSFEDD